MMIGQHARPTLRALYLAQTDDAELDVNAREAAEFLGLEYERRLTGYGDLTGAIAETT